MNICVFTFEHIVSTYEQLTQQIYLFSQLTKRFKETITTGSILASSKILNYTCWYSDRLQR